MRTLSLSRGPLVIALAVSTSCATIVNSSTQPVTIVSDPPAAEVIVDAEGSGSTPTDVRLRRNDEDAALRLQKDGFVPRVVRPRRGFSRWLIANLVVPAVWSTTLVPTQRGEAFAGMAAVGFLTDLFITGEGFAFPDTVRTTLAPTNAPSANDRPLLDTRLAPVFDLRRADGEAAADARESQKNQPTVK